MTEFQKGVLEGAAKSVWVSPIVMSLTLMGLMVYDINNIKEQLADIKIVCEVGKDD